MLGKSFPEYIFIRTAIAGLRLIAPLSVLWVTLMLLVPALALDLRRTFLYSCLQVYTALEAAFFLYVYLPRRYHLQKAANHPVLSHEERRALFQRCSEYIGTTDYPCGWFYQSRSFHKNNVVEWLLWAFFSTSMNANSEEWQEEIAEYLAVVEDILGEELPGGYNEDTPCMRLTLDPVRMVHRPLLWYMLVGIIDFVSSVRLYSLGFRHYSHKGPFLSFPSRLLTLFSRSSDIEGLSYWYRPHRSLQQNPILFLHGIGIGLYPYVPFLADLTSQYPDVGIIVPEFLFISSRITSPPLSRDATLAVIQRILDTHAHPHVVVAAHSYGTVVTAQLLRSAALAPRITATLLVDPIPFLLHLPDVAYNFVYRRPRTANEWMLWYFSSRDPDVSRALSRHFFWTENVLWKDDLDGRDVAVVLSGRDQVINAEAVRKYLTGEDEPELYWRSGRLEVVCFPELDHAMVFDTDPRRRRLMNVFDRLFYERN